MASTEAAPTVRGRLLGVDAARGVALFGIMAVHLYPAVDDTIPWPALVAGDRATALFPILAGVGLALATGGESRVGGSEMAQFRAGLVMRAAIIAAIGLILGMLGSGAAVILVHFGVLFVLAIPFLRLTPQVLLPLAVAWAILAPVISHALRLRLPAPIGGSPTPAALQQPVDLARELLLTGHYPLVPWMAYVLVGLGVGRLALATRRTALTLLVTGLCATFAAWCASWALMRLGDVSQRLAEAGSASAPPSGTLTDGGMAAFFDGVTPTTSWWWLTVVSPYSNTSFDIAHAGGAAIAVLGALLLAARPLRWLLLPLGAAGSMTLTLYSLHIILLATALPADREHAYVAHLAIALAIAVPWRAFVGRGPLEALTEHVVRPTRALLEARA